MKPSTRDRVGCWLAFDQRVTTLSIRWDMLVFKNMIYKMTILFITFSTSSAITIIRWQRHCVNLIFKHRYMMISGSSRLKISELLNIDFTNFSNLNQWIKRSGCKLKDCVCVRFSQATVHQVSLHSVEFWLSYPKNNKGDIFTGSKIISSIQQI